MRFVICNLQYTICREGAIETWVRATVAYDGTNFHGFQVQVGQRTVQGTLEEALAQVTQESCRVVGAGRTDAGVHARGQVIAFHTHWRHSWEELERALNAVLPPDVVVSQVEPAPADFHPRYSARSREYRYTIYNHPLRSPFYRYFAYHVAEPLDVATMARASDCLVGRHDFATFGQPPQGENTVREVLWVLWVQEGPLVHFDIAANAFLYRMVRSIVGTLLLVGRGRLSPEEFREILEATDRSRAGPTVPPQGLCLMRVNY